MQATEFCGISIRNLAAAELLAHPVANEGDYDSACTRAASLQEAARRGCEKEKGTFSTTIQPNLDAVEQKSNLPKASCVTQKRVPQSKSATFSSVVKIPNVIFV